MVRKSLLIIGAAAALSMCLQAEADTIPFAFSGSGFTGSGVLTYVPDRQKTRCYKHVISGVTTKLCQSDPVGAYAIKSITGTFSDTTDGISNATITGLLKIRPAAETDDPFDPLVPFLFHTII